VESWPGRLIKEGVRGERKGGRDLGGKLVRASGRTNGVSPFHTVTGEKKKTFVQGYSHRKPGEWVFKKERITKRRQKVGQESGGKKGRDRGTWKALHPIQQHKEDKRYQQKQKEHGRNTIEKKDAGRAGHKPVPNRVRNEPLHEKMRTLQLNRKNRGRQRSRLVGLTQTIKKPSETADPHRAKKRKSTILYKYWGQFPLLKIARSQLSTGPECSNFENRTHIGPNPSIL